LIDTKISKSLGEYIDKIIEKKTDVKETTRTVYKRVKRNLLAYFPSETALNDITRGDAEDWVRHLKTLGLADNTIRRHTGVAKQYFADAVNREIIPRNPFEGQVSSVQPNSKRYHFVTSEAALKVIDACPDAQW